MTVPSSSGVRNLFPTITSSPNQRLFPFLSVPLRHQTFRFKNASKVYVVPGLKRAANEYSSSRSGKGIFVCAYDPNSEANSVLSGQKITNNDGVEPFRGKSGSISFNGLTHQLVEEGKLVSAPFNESSGSLLWVLGPVALISSLLLPQLIEIALDGFFKDEILSEIVASISSEVIFYVGVATFLLVTDRVQRPYLQFSPKRWGLITGLKGYLTSAFLAMGFKVFAPLFAAYVTWPLLGLHALVSVAPFLAGCLVQLVFEKSLDKRRSSCWPLVPIIFEVYRLHQLTKAVHFIEKLMFAMRGLTATPELMEKSGALAAMIVTFQFLGVVCIWSLLTFIMRLFPSRPVAENY